MNISDKQLLELFIKDVDQSAFEELMKRHGAMVFSTCKRVLMNAQDAEDAFQATFMILSKSAASIRKQDAIGSWLYAVATRTASHLKTKRRLQKDQEDEAMRMIEFDTASNQAEQVYASLDEELERLPPKYRAPLVSCYLEGKTYQQVAEELESDYDEVRGMLERGRKLLRDRLEKRGITISVASLTAIITQNQASAVPASPIVESTKNAAMDLILGKTITSATPTSVTLMKEMVQIMFMKKLKTVTLVLLITTLGAAGFAFQINELFLKKQSSSSVQEQKVTVEPPKMQQASQLQIAPHSQDLNETSSGANKARESKISAQVKVTPAPSNKLHVLYRDFKVHPELIEAAKLNEQEILIINNIIRSYRESLSEILKTHVTLQKKNETQVFLHVSSFEEEKRELHQRMLSSIEKVLGEARLELFPDLQQSFSSEVDQHNGIEPVECTISFSVQPDAKFEVLIKRGPRRTTNITCNYSRGYLPDEWEPFRSWLPSELQSLRTEMEVWEELRKTHPPQ
jgi:RNA polymerase sigma factor (sigma-70 family)